MIQPLYSELLKKYGSQGWWPLISYREKTGCAYHPQDYSVPKTAAEQFEIICGAVLTQNTAWKNAEKAVHTLHEKGFTSPYAILSAPQDTIKRCIRCAGYYNQKYSYLITLCRFLHHRSTENAPTRSELLDLRGIGKETADTLLLYAWRKPQFIVDAYTRRILQALHLISPRETYDSIQEKIIHTIPRDPNIYNEFHALFVVHGKNHYSTRKEPDPVKDLILRRKDV
jgi:endonuclease-3 related protein